MISKRLAHLATVGCTLTLFLSSGNYSGSCPTCDLSHDKTLILTCACENTDTHYYTSSLDLSMAPPTSIGQYQPR